jgi:EmrB/QacA subfamily drug resistance transporter
MKNPLHATVPHTSTSSSKHKIAILLIILVSYVMIVLDTSIVLTGLPKIRHDLEFTDAGLAWVHSAYTLTFGGFLLLAARAGDIFGRRNMLVWGLVIFTGASLAIGFAPTASAMVAARAVQGLGAAILAPSTLALLQITFTEPAERMKAVSYYSAVAGIAASVGLVLGGVLAEYLSWRVGFFINLPIGIAMIWAAHRYIAESERTTGGFDIAGAFSSTVGMGALVFGFIRSASESWSDPVTLGAIAVAVVTLVVFVFNERSARQPIMPLSLFASRERAAAYSARVLFLGGMIGFFFFTTLYLQEVRHFSAARAGIAFLPLTLVNFGVALFVPRLSARFGSANVLAAGLLLSFFGMGWLSRAGADSAYLLGVALPMILLGAGQGLALSPLTSAGISGVKGDNAGAASGVVNVAHQLGNSLGLSVLIAVAAAGTRNLHGAALLVHRVSTALSTATAMMGLSGLLVCGLIVWPAVAARRALAVSQQA